MAVIPAVTAGVGLIGGISSISAKNAQADQQRQQIANESYQRTQAYYANEATLAAQQQLARQQYENSTLARLAQFYQAESALNAQKQSAQLAAQQQAYQLEANALQQALAAQQQSDGLARQAIQIQTDTNAKLSQGALEGANLAEAGAQTNQQLVQQLTQEQRKQLSLEASGQMSTTSSAVRRDKQLTSRLVDAVALGLNIDRNVLAQAAQSMNEEELVLAAQQLGLLDNASNASAVAANLRMLNESTAAGLRATDRNLTGQQQAIDVARQQQALATRFDQNNALDAYIAQDYSLGTQRALGVASNAGSQQNLAAAYGNVRGASLLDWMNAGINTYSAVSPLMQTQVSPSGYRSIEYSVPQVRGGMYVPTSYGPNMPTSYGSMNAGIRTLQ